MADTKKDTKKVKTDEKAAETIVDEVTAESADTAETTTTDVVDETTLVNAMNDKTTDIVRITDR